MKKNSLKTEVAFSEKTAFQNGIAESKSIDKTSASLPAGLNTSACLLSKTENILSPVFDVIDTPVCVLNEEYLFADANTAFCKIYGYTKEEFLGGTITKIFTTESRQWLQNRGTTSSSVWNGNTKDGTVLSNTITAAHLLYTNGKKYQVVTIQASSTATNEITALQSSEYKYRSAIENSLTAFFLTHPGGQILDANEAACHLFGYSIAEFKQVGRNGIIDAKDPNYLPFLNTRKKEGKMKGLLTGIKKNGDHFPIECSSVIFQDHNGETRTTVSIIDISETIKLHRENLLLINNIEESFVIIDKDLRVVNFNKKFETICSEILVNNVKVGESILLNMPAEYVNSLKNICQRVFTGEKIINETGFTLKGVLETYQHHFKPLTDENGNIISAFVTSINITEKKKALQELTASKERYKALVDNGHEGVVIFSANTEILYVSAVVSSVFGYTEEEAFQKNPLSLVHPDDVSGLEKQWGNLLANRGMLLRNHLCRMQHKDGSWRWIESNFNNLLHNASVAGIVNNFRDVTERIKATEKIRESEENLRVIFENTDEGFALINENYTIITFNNIARYNVFTGIQMQAGDNILNYVEEHRKASFKEIFSKVMVGESFNYDLSTSNKETGKPLWVNINISPVKENDKITAACLTGRDITKQKEKDLKIAQTKSLLKRAESVTHVGSVEVDYLNNDHLWSEGLYGILGLKPGDIEPSKESFVRFIHPEDKEYYINTFDKKISEEAGFIQIEIRLISADKKAKNIMVYAQPEYTADGLPAKLLLVIQDITTQKEAERKIAQTQNLLSSAESIARIGSAEINIQTGKRIWSDEFYRIVGLEPGSVEPSAEGIIHYLHPDEKAVYIQWLQNGLANKIEFQQLQTRIIKAGGEERTIMAYGSTRYDAQGKPDILIGVIQDITETKKMEEELMISKEVYQSLFYQNPAAVFSLNLDGYITSANNILALKAECSEDELVKMHYSAFVFPEDVAEVQSYFEKVKAGATHENEIRIITAKGNLLHTLMIALPIIVNNKITGVYCIANDITKEKKSLDLLNKTLADRQRILDYSFDMICEIDAGGRFIQVSKACEKVLGYTPEELIGQSFIEFVVEGDKKETQEMAKYISERNTQTNNFENRYFRKDGGIVSLFWSARWDTNENTMYCIAKDATEKKAQEQALGLSEQRYQNLFNNNPLPLYIADFKTREIIEANHAAFEKYGYTKKEFLSITLDELRPKSEILMLNKMLGDDESFSHIKERIWTHKKKNGVLMYMNSTASLIDYNDKKCVLTLLDDVTEKIKAEEAIRESEEKRMLIMNAALDAIICMDLQGKITFWNPQAEKIFGWKESEVLGAGLSNLIIPERYRKLHHQGMDNYLATGKGPALNSMLNLSAINKDQKEFPIELTIQSIKQKGEEFFCSFIRDVTEQRKAESLKNFERRDKEALINSTNDLIWSVSKDLKLIAGNKAFIKNYKADTGINIKPGDYLLRKDAFAEEMLLLWHEMYYCALSGETIKKEINTSKKTPDAPSWIEVSFNPIYNDKEITGIACYSRNITETKLHQDNLLTINKKLETAQQMAKLGYWQIDLKTNTAFWSDELYHIHGFTKTDSPLPLQKIAEAIHPDDVKNVMRYYIEATEGKRPYHFEHRIILKNGTIKVLLQKGALLYNNQGEPIALEGTSQDITFQKLAEKAAKDSEEKYRMIFNCSPLPNWIYDLETLQIMEVNDAAIALYGYRSDEFLNMSIRELFTTEELPAVIQVNKGINNYGLVNFGQWRHVKKDGTVINVDITGHSIFYNNRNAVMIVSNDITEIIQSQQALVKSIERFEYATKATSDAIWDCDLVNDSVFWGEGFNTLFGYKMKDPKPGLRSWENFIHPGDKTEVLQSMNEVINDTEKNYWQREYRFRKFDGTYTTVSDSALVIRDEKGKPYRIIGAMQDITKRIQNEIILKELNEQLNKRAAELASSNAELEQFAYIASHDLQEPLRMVTSFLSQIQKKYEDQLDETGRVYIRFAVDGAVRMRKIIQDLLEYSRVGWQKYQYEKINIDQLLKEVVSIYSNMTDKKRVNILWGNMPEIMAAKIPLHQLFQNLISNAVKYQQPDTVPEINITATEFEHHWQFAVSDNGIGIEPEYFNKIFVIFQRLHNKDEYSGTGIGLAICKKIIENHNGTLWVESATGKGSTFYFTIPKQIVSLVPDDKTMV